jgi:hypothetical protein
MKTIDFILDRKFHLHTPKKEGFRTASKVALKKKGALFGHSSPPSYMKTVNLQSLFQKRISSANAANTSMCVGAS